MLKRSIVLFTFGVAAVLFGVSQTDAQPGKAPKGGADVKKLEEDLARLLDQVKDTQDKLARAKEATGEKKGFEGKKGFGGKKDFFKGKDYKDFFKGKGKGFEGKKGFGFGGFGKGPFGKGGEKLDPETVKERYEFYKKLYDDLPKEKAKGKGEFKKGPPDGKGKGKGFEGKGKGKGEEKASGNIEARIDRLIRELEQLRGELKKSPGRKRDRDEDND